MENMNKGKSTSKRQKPKFCANCGEKIGEGNFCGNCGERFT